VEVDGEESWCSTQKGCEGGGVYSQWLHAAECFGYLWAGLPTLYHYLLLVHLACTGTSSGVLRIRLLFALLLTSFVQGLAAPGA